MTFEEEFDEKWIPEPNTGCFIWIGRVDKDEYGIFKHKRAPRIAFHRWRGKIPDGEYVLHHCDNPRCVNPDHLFSGRQIDNMRDCVNKGRIRRGHKLSAEHKAKIRAANIGRKMSVEALAKMSAWQKGRPKQKASVEARAKMSASRTGMKNHMFGKKHTAEARAKISVARRRRG